MTSFVPYDYRPQFSEGSAPIGQGVGASVGSQEGPSYSKGNFTYISGDTTSGVQLVGWRDDDGNVIDLGGSYSTNQRGFGVLDKFLCIPSDGSLGPMSLSLFSYTALKEFADDFVVNGISATVYQYDYKDTLPTSAFNENLHVLYGPDGMQFRQLDNSVRTRLNPVGAVKPGVPMFLRLVAIPYVVHGLLPTTITETLFVSDNQPAPPDPTRVSVVPSAYRLFYTIPMSISRVAK